MVLGHAMGERDASYTLAGIVEVDDTFFGAPTEGGKRRRGTKQTPVIVTLSLDKKGCPKYLKMQVIPDVKGATLVGFAQKYIEADSTISSDKYRSYLALAKEGYQHEAKLFNPVEKPRSSQVATHGHFQRQSFYRRYDSRPRFQTSSGISQ